MKRSDQRFVKITLEDWEANDLHSVLVRLRDQKMISKSQFSLREKATARRFLELLEDNG